VKTPSTEWREAVGADEEQRFERYAGQLREIQQRSSARSGSPGRAQHRKQHLGIRAQLEVLDGLPAHARHGLFASARRYDATLRLSNGSNVHGSDKKPDVRGFALRVGGVQGPGALGTPTTAQCFLLINNPTFSFRTVDEFMDVVNAAARSPLAVLIALIKRHGFFGGLKWAKQLGQGLGKPFGGFAVEPFHSAAPIACGPYAAKLRLVPGADNGPAARAPDWAADIRERLAARPLQWDLQLQFFVDEDATPIEDPTVQWPEVETPFVTVARLTAPQQDLSAPAAVGLASEVEAAAYDPWVALAEHRPLGEIMRARKPAYFASQQGRKAS
jgi:hypothetical protein